MFRFAAVAVLGLGLAALAADDDKKADDKKRVEKKSDKAPDWSAFASAGEVSGEVVKADDDGLTLRLSWQTAGKARPKQFRPQNPTEKYQDYQLTFAEN